VRSTWGSNAASSHEFVRRIYVKKRKEISGSVTKPEALTFTESVKGVLKQATVHIDTNYELRTTNLAFELPSTSLVCSELADLEFKTQDNFKTGGYHSRGTRTRGAPGVIGCPASGSLRAGVWGGGVARVGRSHTAINVCGCCAN
jgi:hypothetical protein